MGGFWMDSAQGSERLGGFIPLWGVKFPTALPYFGNLVLALICLARLRARKLADSPEVALGICLALNLCVVLSLRVGNLQYMSWVLPFEVLLAGLLLSEKRGAPWLVLTAASSHAVLGCWVAWLYVWRRAHYGIEGAVLTLLTIGALGAVLYLTLETFLKGSQASRSAIGSAQRF
jgi:hypothetical protein